MKTATTKEEIAQWVIDNRYPKSENEKTTDSEMYHFLLDSIQDFAAQQNGEVVRERDEAREALRLILELGMVDNSYAFTCSKMKTIAADALLTSL
jgi:hypothetical protein